MSISTNFPSNSAWIHEFLAKFGFGQRTGIDLRGEENGLLPSREWKRRARDGMPWFPGDTVNIGIGQGFLLTTPLQLAQSTAVLASRGTATTPHLVTRINDSESGESVETPIKSTTAVGLDSDWAWEFIVNSMEEVTHGTRGTASVFWRVLSNRQQDRYGPGLLARRRRRV